MGGQPNAMRALVFLTAGALGAFACGGTATSSGSNRGGAMATAGSTGGGSTPNSGGADAAGKPSGGSDPETGEAGSTNTTSAGATGCAGLECDVPACGNGTTSISGKVFDPSLTLPLYNVTVFVPNGPVPMLVHGPVCERCGSPGVATVATTTTDQHGNFTLEDVPAGKSVPLVVQIGKWRRQLTLSNVAPCADLALDPELTRLPRNQTEGELPRIAIAAGAADQMECLPRRMGIDDSEFTTSTGDGAVHLYSGHYTPGGATANSPITAFAPELNSGAMLPSADELWKDAEALSRYDLVLLSCEGRSFEERKPMTMRQGMYYYLSAGGRVLASHWHHVWFSSGPDPVPMTGTWSDRNDPTEGGAPIEASVNQSFAKGEVLAAWLLEVGASAKLGSLMINYSRDSVQAVHPQLAREWLTLENPRYPDAPKSVQYLSFTAPLGVPIGQTCGRGAFTDLHVSDANVPGPKLPFPQGCEDRALSAQEKAIAFMLFDLSSCVDDSDIP